MKTIALVVIGIIILSMINTEVTFRPFSVKFDVNWYYMGGWVLVIVGYTLLMAESFNQGQTHMLEEVQENLDYFLEKRSDESTQLQKLEDDSDSA